MHGRKNWVNAPLLFASGAAGLVYEVLWMKQLGLLFGNTAYAAATTLAAVFLGFAVGGLVWGRRAAGMRRPLRGYAMLELGIAATAMGAFLLPPLYRRLYPLIFQAMAASAPLAVAIKFALSVAVVFPPALFMGGTVPLMSEHLIRDPRRFGRSAALLYGVNTLGAALGAYLAGFHLPLWWGYRITFAAALGVTLAVAAVAWWLSRTEAAPPRAAGRAARPRRQGPPALSPPLVGAICVLSGFGVLGFEVLWTRMFAQVLQNSVYTFAAVLVTVLAALAAGAGVASLLARLPWRPASVLFVLLPAAGMATAAAPFVFMHLTDNMKMVGSSTGWAGYVFDVFRLAAATMGLPACLLGTVFPYLLKVSESRVRSAGRTMGELSALNTVGAIAGALLAGFVMLDWVGLWPSLRIYSLAYFLPVLAFPLAVRRLHPALRIAAVGAIVLSVYRLDPSSLLRARIDPAHGETLRAVYEGSGGTAAVTDTLGALAIKLNNHYGLGSTAAIQSQEVQADIPLMIRPKTDSVYFLGMGTGITPGTALAPYYNVRRVVTCELSGEVVAAAKDHFRPYVNGLFTDPRSEVVVDDGRHYLAGTGEQFDLIDADLFVPFRSGAGNLYTVEHFRTARRRLAPGGWFAQWLPLYQVTEREFGIIARSMLAAFDQVTVWRNSFYPGKEIICLVGHRDRGALEAVVSEGYSYKAEAVKGIGVRNLRSFTPLLTPQTALAFYCGDLSAVRGRFDKYPLNTDDHPVIEYLAPLSHQRQEAGEASWFVGERLLSFLEDLQQACPPESDPVLANQTPADRRLPRAGLHLHQARLHVRDRSYDRAERAWSAFVHHWLAQDKQNTPSVP